MNIGILLFVIQYKYYTKQKTVIFQESDKRGINYGGTIVMKRVLPENLIMYVI